jgi:hypothetical protein
MKIEKLFIGLMGLSILFLTLSLTIWKNISLDFHVHDVYYVVSSTYVAICCAFVVTINAVIYKLIGAKNGLWNYWIPVAHMLLFVLSLTLFTGLWFTLDYLTYLQNSLTFWGLLTFILSEMLIVIYYFLPEQKIG